jgi:hypothetical protein
MNSARIRPEVMSVKFNVQRKTTRKELTNQTKAQVGVGGAVVRRNNERNVFESEVRER